MTVGVAGITNAQDGIVVSVTGSAAWRNIPFRDLLKQRFECAVFVENDTNLAAIGEHFRGVAQAENSFVFIGVGSGVGAGIFLNGQIVHGASWSAGEIGYLQIPNISSMHPTLYELGALEQVLGAPGIVRSWNAMQGKASVSKKTRAAIKVLEYASAGNPVAQEIVQQRARLLKDVVLNLSLILNPNLFVLGGEIGAHPALLDLTVQLLQQSEVAITRVLPSSLGSSAVAWGALAVAMKHSEQILLDK